MLLSSSSFPCLDCLSLLDLSFLCLLFALHLPVSRFSPCIEDYSTLPIMSFSAKQGERYTVESSAYGPGAPPPCENSMGRGGSKWHPKNWTKRTIIAVVILAVVVLVAIIVGAVLGSTNSSYPDYTPLEYTLQDTYAGENFFDDFVFFNDYDPAGGFVHYVPQATANSSQYNLTYASADSAVLRVDTSEQNADTGRYSVRITSKKQYNSGLFVFDVLNTPYGCSTWPALWLSDPSNWPENGTIDRNLQAPLPNN